MAVNHVVDCSHGSRRRKSRSRHCRHTINVASNGVYRLKSIDAHNPVWNTTAEAVQVVSVPKFPHELGLSRSMGMAVKMTGIVSKVRYAQGEQRPMNRSTLLVLLVATKCVH